MAARSAAFDPTWLAARLAVLLPQYPRVDLCVAFSGGLDSTVLLTALAMQRTTQTSLRAVHVDHGLQPRSPRWATHCRSVARALRVPLLALTETVARSAGESLEARARAQRYRAIAAQLRRGEVLLTAHHADDQLETVLLQLLRGAGLPGIAAMPAVAPFAAGQLVRPLLTVERAHLHAWACAQGLAWIDDDSNADERFDRNFLRRQILPMVRARWPAAARAAARTARHAAQAQGLLDMLARADVERAAVGAAVSAARLRALGSQRRRNALRFWIASAGRILPDTRRLDELAGALLDARPDGKPRVAWNGTAVERHADLLTLAADAAAPAAFELSWPARRVPVLQLPHGLGTLMLRRSARGPIDRDRLPARLTVRLRRGGERLRPRRGGPGRSLKTLLQEARIAPAERARLPLLFDGERLIAAGDLWADETIQAGPATQHRARLVWKRD